MNVFGDARYIKAISKPQDYSLHDPLPIFRKEFQVDKSLLKTAQIFVQAPGFAEFYINGQCVTEDKFISPLSDYNKILWYNTYDVTELLQDGVNTLGVITSNGYFNEPFETAWNFNTASWRDAPQFMLCLKINGKDAVISDDSWKASRKCSHIIYSHLRSGEYVDMRKKDTSWLLSGYDDSAWKNVISRDINEITGKLLPCECPPVREFERLKPQQIIKTAQGYLVDFEKNSSGYIEISLQEPRGQEVTVRYCEEVDENGKPKHNRMDSSYFYGDELYSFQTDKIIASGQRDVFKPTFCYHGFRYVVIEGLSKPPLEEEISAIFIHNDVKKKADFSCGNEIINFIYNAGIRSTYSNMFWSLTDCPTREKMGWTNDSQASAEQMLINFDCLSFFNKWFEDVKADQTESGELHSVIPTGGWGFDWGPVCNCFLFELPYRIYIYTNDSSMMIDAIPYFERYIAFLEKALEENREFILGDWTGNGSSTLIPKKFVLDLYLVKSLKIACIARRLAGLDFAEIQAKLDLTEQRVKEKYLDGDGRCVINEQTSIAMMLEFDLYKDKDTLRHQLVSAVERDGIRITCGMVGIQYIYDALSNSGRADLAYKLITESEPGFKTWYKHGATTLWECWAGENFGSHNHHMFSNVLAWFFKSLLGINPDENSPGFERVIIKPQFIAELEFAKGYMITVRGKIEVEWCYSDGVFTYTIKLPEGIEGEYQGQKLHAGINIFEITK